MAGTLQPLISKASVPPTTGTQQAGWPAVLVQFLTSANGGVPWAVDGVFGNLGVVLDVAPGVGNSRIFTFTNVTTAVTVVVTVSGTNTTNRETVSTLAVAIGDRLLCEETVTGTPAALGSCQLLSEFTGTTTGETGYTMHHLPGNGAISAGSAPYFVAGPMCGTTFTTTNPAVAANIIAIDGSITALVGRSSVAPGAGKSWDFYLSLSTDHGATWVLQDGTGGTVDTKCSVTGTSVPATAVATFDLPVLQGYQVQVQLGATAAPAATRPACAIRFLSTVAGESMVIGRLTTGASNTVTNYGFPIYATGGYNATEAPAQEQAPISTFTLDQLQASLEVAPGAAKSRQLTFRVNSATPGGSPSATISGTVLWAAGTGSAIVNDLDLLAMQAVPSGTPAGSGASTWTFRARAGAFLTTAVGQPPDWPLPSRARVPLAAGWVATAPLSAASTDLARNAELWPVPRGTTRLATGWTVASPQDVPVVVGDLPPGTPLFPLPRRATRVAISWLATIGMTEVIVLENPVVIPEPWAMPPLRPVPPQLWVWTLPPPPMITPPEDIPPGARYFPGPPPPRVALQRSVMLNQIGVIEPPPAPPNCEFPLPPDSGGGTGEP